jgi:hypothetical protein
MDGDHFANLVAMADAGARAFAVVFQVLRREADGGKRVEDVVLADFERALRAPIETSAPMMA